MRGAGYTPALGFLEVESAMTMYLFWQKRNESQWVPALASERRRLVESGTAALITALDIDHNFAVAPTIEEQVAMKQIGDIYFDFDGELEEVITQVKVFLTSLKAKSVSLDQVRIYATGGRGFHIFLPMGMYLGKVPPTGIQGLVHIYREMAFQLYVPTLDMRIYSARRGRMLRVENFQRENGKYKVQISAAEALEMTPEWYAEICSQPRAALPVEPPTFNPELAYLYAQSKDTVAAVLKRRKANKGSVEALSRYAGQWPETLKLVLSNIGVREDIGWNKLSLQLAIFASLLGKTEEQLLADADTLLREHKGDSGRYKSFYARSEDLRTMFRYVADNPCYVYSPGGILDLLIPEIRANNDLVSGEVPDPVLPSKTARKQLTVADLKGNADSSQPEEAPLSESKDSKASAKGDTKPAEPEAPPSDDATQLTDSLSKGLGITVSAKGIYTRSKEGEWYRVSMVGFSDPECIRSLSGEYLGYEVTPYVEGRKQERCFLPANTFVSRAAFNNWCISMGSSMTATDTATSGLNDLLRRMTTNSGTSYAVHREGLDLVAAPGTNKRELIWAKPGQVITSREMGHHYRFHGANGNEGVYKSDLMDAPALSVEDTEFFDNFFKINKPENLGKIFGWFCAAFLTQIIRKQFKVFPSLQVYGQAGAGKSMTISLMNGLHYYESEPRQVSAAAQTQFPILVAMATSASMPLVFEEVKIRQLDKRTIDFLQNVLRSNYMADTIERGTLSQDTTRKGPQIQAYANAAPIAFVGEAIDDQAAILERCVLVDMSKNDRKGRALAFEYVLENRTILGKLGRALVIAALDMDHNAVKTAVSSHRSNIRSKLSAEKAEEASRPVLNLSVAMTGLTFAKSVLSVVFGDRYDGAIDGMVNALSDNVENNLPTNMPEAARVLHVMSLMSYLTDPRFSLILNSDYMLDDEQGTLDIKMRFCYGKYVAYCRNLGQEVLYDTETAFIAGMRGYSGLVSSQPDNSPLYRGVNDVVFRFSVPMLHREGVQGFKGCY